MTQKTLQKTAPEIDPVKYKKSLFSGKTIKCQITAK
jgi:hypothetical protein